MSDENEQQLCHEGLSKVVQCGKYGLARTDTAEMLVPCEMNWMLYPGNAPFWLLGRKNHIGGFQGNVVNPSTKNFCEPIYDAIDLATDRFCLNGRWGWRLTDGKFSESAPSKGETYTHVSGYIPLEYEAEIRFHEIMSIRGIYGIKPLYTNTYYDRPEKRLNLPRIYGWHIDLPTHPAVEEAFSNAQRLSYEFSISHYSCAAIMVRVITAGEEQPKMEICWTDDNQMDMAVSLAFHLIPACNKIVRSDNGRFTMTFSIEFSIGKVELAKKFLSALLTFKDVHFQHPLNGTDFDPTRIARTKEVFDSLFETKVNGETCHYVPMFRWSNYSPLEFYYDTRIDALACNDVYVTVGLAYQDITKSRLRSFIDILERRVIEHYIKKYNYRLTTLDD